MEFSLLQQARYKYIPPLPPVFTGAIDVIDIKTGAPTEAEANQAQLKEIFQETYGKPIIHFTRSDKASEQRCFNLGVVLSGGQAPGGHNVIAGILDSMKSANPKSRLFGFLGGPSGILKDKMIELTPAFLDLYRNTGGFDMIGSGRTKLETEEQFENCIEICKKREIKAIVIIGGDDSNTNAALLAEYFAKKHADITVVGVPKTIDGDLKNELIEISFGFDTATKVYSELIGNIQRDANSARKYWHFIRLMGRSASHISLECALQTHPNLAVISEEVAEKQKTLNQIVEEIVRVIIGRSENGENFGVIIVPEGLIESIPEMGRLIGELNDLLANNAAYYDTLRTFEDQAEWINKNLSKDSSYVFSSLPSNIQRQLLMDRDPHGNVQVSRIETEKLLIEMTESRLAELKAAGTYKGSFSTQSHFLGYEGRAAFPTNFDSNYCYCLGYTAFLLAARRESGYMAAVKNLHLPVSKWEPLGVPMVMMMDLEQRKGKLKPVIKKALVDTEGRPFKTFASHRDTWAIKTSYLYPGPIQYFGPAEVSDTPALSLKLEKETKG